MLQARRWTASTLLPKYCSMKLTKSSLCIVLFLALTVHIVFCSQAADTAFIFTMQWLWAICSHRQKNTTMNLSLQLVNPDKPLVIVWDFSRCNIHIWKNTDLCVWLSSELHVTLQPCQLLPSEMSKEGLEGSLTRAVAMSCLTRALSARGFAMQAKMNGADCSTLWCCVSSLRTAS